MKEKITRFLWNFHGWEPAIGAAIGIALGHAVLAAMGVYK